MLLILTAALLPLGLIAMFASIQSAHVRRLQREADARVVATAEARQIDILLLRGAGLIRNALAVVERDPHRCPEVLPDIQEALRAPVRLALLDGRGRLWCVTPGFSARRLSPARAGIGIDALVLNEPPGLRFTVSGQNGAYGVGELPRDLLAQVLRSEDGQTIVLRQGNTQLRLMQSADMRRGIGRQVTVAAPIAGGQASLGLTLAVPPISAAELLLILLPLLMWVAAAAIGWLVIDQFLVRPLEQLQRAVTVFGPSHAFELPRLRGPSQEIRSLGDAFASAAARLAEREAALEQGLNHQVRLTREVHHRVKNNLQVVASLINLHARGTRGDVANAYATIQRRVDALAVVHRNHYAELEKNHGVALRSIVAELTANLRATAPTAASHLAITLDMVPVFITQDVAVPVAFLVTEIVELVMGCDPTGGVAIAVAAGETRDRAILTIEAAGLTAERCVTGPERAQFERIVLGLSRQLRSELAYDANRGRYRIAIATLLPDPDGEA